MKLAREDIIQACEKHLLKLIVKNIDKSALKQAVREKYDLAPGGEIAFHNGDIVVKNNKIVYRLDFSVRADLSLLLDRSGEPIDITASDNPPDKEGDLEPEKGAEDGSRQIAADIARMISEINE